MPQASPYIEISLDNLLHNCAELRSSLPEGTGVLAVVKDNAYGCGSRVIANALEKKANITFFAVNRPSEAFFLRKNGIRSPVLVLGNAIKNELKKGWPEGIVFTLNSVEDLSAWKSAGVPVRFHCNIDTRMHRMGIMPPEVAAGVLAGELSRNANLHFEGAFTHFANADVPGTPTMHEQLRIFSEALAVLKKQGHVPQHIHYANSAAVMRLDSLPVCTLIRPGITLYGCKPDPKQDFPLKLLPVAAFKSRVVKIKNVPAGTPVSYGGRYVTDRETCIATIALGYGNGLPRSLGNRGSVLVRGRRFTIAGTVTMDYIMIDAGPDPALKVGDEVVAMGCQGNECITPDDIAVCADTIAYEILCGMSASIDRIYMLEGRMVAREKGRFF